MTAHKHPRVLLFDIETMANKAFVWGKYEQDVLSFEKQSYMLTFSYKWLDEKKARVASLPDYKDYKKDKTNDKALCLDLWRLFDEADVVVGHNSESFDIKKANARFVQHGFPPPKPFKSVDTLKISRRYFKFESNKLDDLGQSLGVGRKIVHTGWDLWLGCAVRDEKSAWDKMAEYNKQDVLLLERVYLKLRPWMINHPNFNLYAETENFCPACGGKLERRGYRFNRTTKYQQFKCLDCGSWSSKPITGLIR